MIIYIAYEIMDLSNYLTYGIICFFENRKVKKKKSITLDHFYKKRACESEIDEQGMTPPSQPVKVPRIEEVITSTSQPVDVPRIEEDITHTTQPADVQRIEELHNAGDFLKSLERDPGKRSPIWTFPPNHVDEIRRAYLNWGPYQIHLEEYPLSGKGDHPRRFKDTWFSLFHSWLEYSPSKDAAFCLPCYLFNKGPNGRSRIWCLRYYRF